MLHWLYVVQNKSLFIVPSFGISVSPVNQGFCSIFNLDLQKWDANLPSVNLQQGLAPHNQFHTQRANSLGWRHIGLFCGPFYCVLRCDNHKMFLLWWHFLPKLVKMMFVQHLDVMESESSWINILFSIATTHSSTSRCITKIKMKQSTYDTIVFYMSYYPQYWTMGQSLPS